MREWKTKDIKVLENAKRAGDVMRLPFTAGDAKAVRLFHQGIPGYKKTQLASLPALAEMLGVRGIFVKDESQRFGLKAFKGLGGSYAMFRILCGKLSLDPQQTTMGELAEAGRRGAFRQMEFVTCTDGNHGKGVSWAAGLFGCRAHVYMPFGTQKVRAEAIRKAGPAEVVITDLSYDNTVKYAKEQSEEHGWILIQDTSWKGYEEIPAWIIQGYLTMMDEAAEELDSLGVRPTHVFVQAGVGAMAGGVLSYIADRYAEETPVMAVVEADAADCIYRSVKMNDGRPHTVEGTPVTMMAGLNCGTPCACVWPVLRDIPSFYISCGDRITAEGMRSYAASRGSDPVIVSGESGAVTLGAVQSILTDTEFSGLREAMGITKKSVVFLINTEGDTDPENYQKIISGQLFN